MWLIKLNLSQEPLTECPFNNSYKTIITSKPILEGSSRKHKLKALQNLQKDEIPNIHNPRTGLITQLGNNPSRNTRIKKMWKDVSLSKYAEWEKGTDRFTSHLSVHVRYPLVLIYTLLINLKKKKDRR